jgi:orotate phosphoribosyltransferase
MRLFEKPNDQVVLFDDVLTSGSQLIAAARFLTKEGVAPVRGAVVARATKEQRDKPFLQRNDDTLELSRSIFDFNDF